MLFESEIFAHSILCVSIDGTERLQAIQCTIVRIKTRISDSESPTLIGIGALLDSPRQ